MKATKVKYNLRKPCMGLFLQNGVKAIATVEVGPALVMLGIGTAGIIDHEKQNNEGTLGYVIYSSCYFHAIVSMILAQQLFTKASQRDAEAIFRVWLASLLPCAICVACFVYFTVDEGFDLGIFAIFVAYIVYKVYTLWVILYFIFEIRRSNGVNPALRDLSDTEVEEFFDGGPPFEGDNYGDLPYKKEVELEKGQITLNELDILGTGAFGVVMMGHDFSTGKGVAVKKSGREADVSLFKAMLTELKILIAVGSHENIVNLVGACTANIKRRNILIVLELCELGNLQDYLRRNRCTAPDSVVEIGGNHSNENERIGTTQPFLAGIHTVTVADLFLWSLHTAKGMEFISSKHIVHGDLATRNVLLTREGIAKISDFGLSRELGIYSVYLKTTNEPLPWRWMSPEALNSRLFSTSSDVWSFGVVLWEYFTYAQTPYQGWEYTPEFVYKLSTLEIRLEKPALATPQTFDIMRDCLNPDQKCRPTFTELRVTLESMLPIRAETAVDGVGHSWK